MAPMLPVFVLVAAASFRGCEGGPPVELALGVLGSFDEDFRTLAAIVVADLDFRKYSEPDLVARFGPPILQMPNKSFYPGLRVRPLIMDDWGQDAAGLSAGVNFALGMNGYPKVQGLLGPTLSNVALATAPCGAAYKLNQVAIFGATSESLSDKTRFPFFFRTNTPGSQQGHIMWLYADYFGFRGVTLLSVLQESSQAIQEGFLSGALMAHRSEVVKGMTVPNTMAAEAPEWASAIAFAKAAHNRLVIVVAPSTMAATFLRYVPNNGVCAPQYQLLMTPDVNGGSEWPISMDRMHLITPERITDSRLLSFMKMFLGINASDVLSGMQRYGLDRWYNRSRIFEVVAGAPSYGVIGLSLFWFNVFNLFVRAFGELLNEGVAPDDIGGDLLRAKLAQADLDGVRMRLRFDASQDGMMDWFVSSITVRDPTVSTSGVLSAFDEFPLAACRVSKAANGSTLYNMVPIAPQRWATGEVSLYAPASLTACPPGQYLSLGGGVPLGMCLDCPEGTFTNTTDQTECTRCPAGTRGDESRTVCVACPPGAYNPDKGSKECLSCMSGSVAAGNGSKSCELCPLGTYANTPHAGATFCVPCEDGLTTLQVASLGVDDCVCAAGTYRPLGGGPCAPCGAGLRCPAGSEEANIPGWGRSGEGGGPYPEVLPMYYTSAGAPFSVYQCVSDVVCPGGPPESCSPNQVGLACGDCAKGHYRSPSGRCEACATNNAVPLSMGICLAVICITLLAIYSQQEEGGTRQTLMTAVLVAGQLVACVQALSVIQQVKITWVQPLLTVWQLTGFVSFDMDLLKVACVLRQDRPVGNFAMQLAGLPVLAVLLGILMILISRIRARMWRSGRRFSWDRYLNLLGLLAVMVYISITVAMLRPVICKRHPNGLRSVASRMAVICWQSTEHRALVALSAIGVLCYPVSLLTTVAWATAMYPLKAATGSLAHLSRFKFVFARFTPACYYWGFWYLLRNLLIALVPVVVPDSGVWQMMMLCILFLPFMATEAVLLPWRTMLANFSEVVTLLCVLLFLQAAGFLVGSTSGGSTELVSYLLLAILLALLLATASVLGYALVRTLYPGLQYSIFLCHHKEGAGSLARWMKMQVASVSRAAVFLDSDQLEELDLIVDTVRCRTKNLLILLTRLTLSRIWCAAELASAVAHKVPIVPLACCDYQPCSQEQLDHLGDMWSELQKHSVAQYGINLDHIRKAYEHLAGLTTVELRRFAPLEDQRVAAFRALHLCGVCGPTPPARAGAAAAAPAHIAVAGASSDAEARTTCEVLQHMVQVKTEVPVVAVHCWQDAQPHAAEAAYLLVVLTRGLIQDAAFTEVVLEFDTADRPSAVEIVTALADTNFVFPAAEVFEAMERQGGDQERLSKFFRRIFNILALPVSPHGSAGIMAAQVGELCRRFKDTGKAGAVQRASSTRSSAASDTFQAAELLRSLWRGRAASGAAQHGRSPSGSPRPPAADVAQQAEEEAVGLRGTPWSCTVAPGEAEADDLEVVGDDGDTVAAKV